MNYLEEDDILSRKKRVVRHRFRIDIDTKDARLIHICYNGQETTRITDAIIEEKPTKLYYLHHVADIYLQYRDQNLDLIRKTFPSIEIEEQEVDYVSYFSIIGELIRIFKQEFKIPKTKIIINLGSGSKMVACANMDIFRIFPENVALIYPYSKDYHPERIGSVHEGAMHAAKPPEFTYKEPSPEVLRGLQVLYSLCRNPRFGESKWFTYFGDWDTRWKIAVNQFIANTIVPSENAQENDKKEQPIRKRHDSKRILRLLEQEWELIRQEDRNLITITTKGKNMMGVFRHFDYKLDLDKLEQEATDNNVNSPALSIEEKKTRETQEILEFDGPKGKFIDDDGHNYKRKVQIIFNAKEYDRITAPVLQDLPDCIYYFTFKSNTVLDLYLEYKSKNIKTILNGFPNDHKCEIIEDTVDYVDYYAIIGKMATIFSRELKREPNTRIAINLGTGSKMCAIAVMDAYRIWPHNVVPFYLFSRDYNTKRDAPFHIGNMIRAEVPLFKLKAPEPEIIQAMQILGKSLENPDEDTKTQYAYQLKWQNNMLASGIIHEPKTAKEKLRTRESAIKNVLRNRRKKLKEWFYIVETKEGNQWRLNLTDLGKKMLRIFQYFEY